MILVLELWFALTIGGVVGWICGAAIVKNAQEREQEEKDEHGWVIEKKDSEVAQPIYWAGLDQWSQYHEDAIRFARKLDAERVATKIGLGHRVAEHIWVPKYERD